MISLASGITLVVAFAITFIISRLIVKRRAANAAIQERQRVERLRQNLPPPVLSKNKSKRRRQERTQR
jgi:heme exporter protein D